MSGYRASNSLDEQSPTLHSDFGPNMMSDEQTKQQKQPLISFKYHPGFFCFFEEYTNNKGLTYHECYQKVFESHHQMMKIKRSTQQIVKDESLAKQQKIKQLMYRAQKDKIFAYYVKRPEGELQCNVAVYEDRRIQQINRLKQQLQKLQKIKSKVIEQKKRQFQQKQILKSKQQQLQIQGILNQKQRRANLIRKIQLQSMQKRVQRQKQGKTNFITSTINNNCEIM